MHCFHILCCLVSIQAALDFQFVEKLEKGWEFNVKLMLKIQFPVLEKLEIRGA